MDSEDETQQADVGALGWLGFIIINGAAWGTIATASMASWVFGFVVCVFYTGLLYMHARYMENKDEGDGKIRYHRFLNLLWVLISTFMFIDGAFLSLRVFGNFSFGDSSSGPEFPPRPEFGRSTLPDLLPHDASTALKDWASTISIHWSSGLPSFATFEDNLYVPRTEVDSDAETLVLAEKGTLETKPVVSAFVHEPVYRARGFQEFESKLYFFADSDEENSWDRATEAIWRVEAAAPNIAVRSLSKEDVVGHAISGPRGSSPQLAWSSLFHDAGASGSLYLVGQYYCHNVLAEHPDCGFNNRGAGQAYVYTIYRTDGTDTGTEDLRGDVCTPLCEAEAKIWDEFHAGTPSVWASAQRMEMWSTLFFAVFPMMYTAWTAIVRKSVPGPVFNLWLGGQMAGIILYMLVGHHVEDLSSALEQNAPIPGEAWGFEQRFITVFNAAGYGLLVLWATSRFRWRKGTWREELKTWATFFVGWASFAMLHVNLRLPTSETGEGINARWTLYATLTAIQLALAVVLRDQTPMLTGACCVFVLSWKVAFEVVNAATFIGEEWHFISLLLLMAFEGVGLIVGAMAFSGALTWSEAEDREH